MTQPPQPLPDRPDPAAAEASSDFTCSVDASTDRAYRVVGSIAGKELFGWVIPVDGKPVAVSNPSPSSPTSAHDISKLDASSPPSSPPAPPSPPPPPPCLPASSVPRRSVVVVGAGIAGIAAARALSDRGFRVIVVEGRGRVGGRIATDWSMGSPVELGACFIHGSYGNPLAMVAREAQLRTYSPRDVQNLLYEDGSQVPAEDDKRAEDLWLALTRRADRIAETVLRSRDIDMSLGELLRKLKKNVKQPPSKQIDLLLSWHAANLEMACAADLEDLSARHYDLDMQFGFSGPHEMVRDGYSSIVHALAQNLDIRLNSPVKLIQQHVPLSHDAAADDDVVEVASSTYRRTRDGARVSAANGTSSAQSDGHASPSPGDANGVRHVRYLDKVQRGDRAKSGWSGWDAFESTGRKKAVRVVTEDGMEYVAESCLVTVPLGVLKGGDIQFQPPLPPLKQEAINNIGFGVVNKVALRFEYPFWATTPDPPRPSATATASAPAPVTSAGNSTATGSAPGVQVNAATNGHAAGGTPAAKDSAKHPHSPPRPPGHARKVDDTTANGNANGMEDENIPDHIGRVTEKHGTFTMFVSLLRCTGAPILVGITVGRFAKYIEQQADDEVVRLALEALRRMYGENRMAPLVDFRVTRWGLDRFTQGSYSFAEVGTSPQDFADMSEPFEQLYFAGEATHRNHPATAHGAFMSGLREASRIIGHSDLAAADRRKIASDLYHMQEPHLQTTRPTTRREPRRQHGIHKPTPSGRRASKQR